jgi:hypothetical protein
MNIGTCTDAANIVQLKELKSAALVAAKMNAMMEDMKSFAHEAVVEHGVKGATAGNLTPKRRFEDDTDVPQKTRYEVPKTLVESTFGASTREIQAMDAWDQRMERMNTSLKKECMAGTSQVVAMLAATTKAMPAKAMPAATTKVSDVQEGNVDIADSQQSALSLADDSCLHTHTS